MTLFVVAYRLITSTPRVTRREETWCPRFQREREGFSIASALQVVASIGGSPCLIGALPPPVSKAGECWTNSSGRGSKRSANSSRVSPLASSFGRETLPLGEQTHIHETFAVQMLSKGKIDASDAELDHYACDHR